MPALLLLLLWAGWTSCAQASTPPRKEKKLAPSTTVESYMKTHLRRGVTFASLLTVDDGVVIPSADGNSTFFVGNPDGLGAYDGAIVNEPDHFYLLVNHEYSPGVGTIRGHGADGSFISRWKVHKETLQVVEGDDLIQEIYGWDWDTETFVLLEKEPLDRMCSADLPPQTALYNSATGLGTQNMIHFNGEEIGGGRALAHVLTGKDARKTFELAHLGYYAFENILINPKLESDMTLAIMPDDSRDGEVYVYIGRKQHTGNDIEKAGLVGGTLYALTVPGEPYEMDPVNGIGTIESFALKTIGGPGNRPTNGTETTLRGLDTNGTYFPMDPNSAHESLKMAGPEDGVWDLRPGHEHTFWFVTKGSYTAASLSGGETAPARLFKLEFEDIHKDPTLGGTMTIMWQYLGSFDNICFDFMDGRPKLYIQEDLGANPVLGKIFEYDITTGIPQELAAFDSQISHPAGSAFLSMSTESSGIVPLPWLGEGYFAVTVQVLYLRQTHKSRRSSGAWTTCYYAC